MIGRWWEKVLAMGNGRDDKSSFEGIGLAGVRWGGGCRLHVVGMIVLVVAGTIVAGIVVAARSVGAVPGEMSGSSTRVANHVHARSIVAASLVVVVIVVSLKWRATRGRSSRIGTLLIWWTVVVVRIVGAQPGATFSISVSGFATEIA